MPESESFISEQAGILACKEGIWLLRLRTILSFGRMTQIIVSGPFTRHEAGISK